MESKRMTKVLIVCLLVIIAILVFLLIHNKTKYYKQKCEVKTIVKKESNLLKVTDEIRKKENILFLGDSITDFYPIDSIFNDLPIVKSGISGYTTQDILDQMDSMVYQYNPTSVFLLIGTNDIMYDGEEKKEETIQKIEKIIENIQKNRKSAKIYLESIYPVNKSLNESMVRDRKNTIIQEMNEELKKYCGNNKVTYINMYDELADGDGNFDKQYTDDGLHPNDLGYAKISQVRLTYIYGMDI